MAAFRIHDDQENALAQKKDTSDVFSTATQRRALGDLSQFSCNQNRNVKLPGLTKGPCKVQDENRTVRLIKNEKNIMPPVAQFRAFSVYEDDAEVKKREPLKSYVSKETRKENYFVAAVENVKALCIQVEKQADRPKGGPELRLCLQEKKDEEKKVVVESPMSIADSSILSMSVSKNESELLENLDDEDAAVAQTDKEMFFHVVEYREDIYEYMKEIEIKNRPNPRYMSKQTDITHMMRSILIDWLVEVCEEYKQNSETLHLAVSYIDRFLSYMMVVRTKLQLVGTAATYIAGKYEEVYPPDVSEFVYITDDTYTKREVFRMEHLILKVLSFDLSTPTSLAFLSHYCISNGLSKKTYNLAAFIAELTLLEADPYLQYKPSVIAAAALATARHCLLCERADCADCAGNQPQASCALVAWPEALSLCSGYMFANLVGCARDLARTHAHAALQPYQAILDKYRSSQYDGVSSIMPKPMFAVARYQPAAPSNSRATS